MLRNSYWKDFTAKTVSLWSHRGIRRTPFGNIWLVTSPHLTALPYYVAVDADELLSSFLVDATPDRDQFFAVMDGIFAKPSRTGRPIRVYGEMVVRLWQAGLPEAALKLEDLWNRLADRYKFSLLCAYPMNLFEGHDTQWFFTDLCGPLAPLRGLREYSLLA